MPKCPADCAHRARCSAHYMIGDRPADLRECLPCNPRPGSQFHEGGEIVGRKTDRTGELVDVMRCRDCEQEWTA